jgi:hypothetical protein
MNRIDKAQYLSHHINKNLSGRFIFPTFLILQFLVFLIWSWRKWPDILIDFGSELYIFWQISAGKVLYHDITHVYGPFSQYLNASLFKLFGISYTTIIAANIAVLGIFLFALYLTISKACSKATAFICCSVIISIFAFSQYVGIGNYNFISPYSHEATHGIVLSLVMIYFLWRFNMDKRKIHLIIASFIFGLIYLTKIEFFFSAFISCAFSFLLYWINYKDSKAMIKVTGIFLGCCLIPTFLFFIYFAFRMPLNEALSGVCGSWICLIKDTTIAGNKFYINGMGFDKPIENFLKMIYHALIGITSVAGILYLSSSIDKHRNQLPYVCLCAILLGITISLVFFINPYSIGRSLPLLNILALLFLFISYILLSVNHNEKAKTYVPLLLWAVFSQCLLWKMVFNCRLFHYGFILSLPSVVLLVSILLWYLPEWLEKRFSGGSLFRIVMIIIIVLLSFKFFHASDRIYHAKNLTVGSGGDRIITYDSRIDPRGPIIANAIAWINTNLDKNETFIALPEGTMLNYLTRRDNPTPYASITYLEMQIFNEDTILNSFKKNAPDYFVFVHNNPAEYGVRFFGKDPKFGKKVMDWILINYFNVCLFGAEPFENNQFGIKIYKKRK